MKICESKKRKAKFCKKLSMKGNFPVEYNIPLVSFFTPEKIKKLKVS